ncbi:cache domain-containing protein [Sulfurospirillum halorespirans]|uniref:Putative diguanylate cyclase n=1 Tax=Sulfurospirillum halorespirans DSM 13726 TaxID=1193502 RepID=A0A1D7TJB3_9BACT|nr:cache domain-containing protein [Sulfurospirillum halorespirans]AOO65099.1 putative diguanylate cyclase [Sulfurospirillum halorespirans DSM 13726]
MDLHKKLSLFHYFHIIALILFVTFASTFFALSFYNAKIKFEKESHRLQKEYSDSKKKMLITEVDRFLEHIEEKRQEAYAQTQQLVKTRVYEAYEIATKLYQTYHKTHSDAQIATMIVDTLRLLRYENNKGYYFITHLDGTEILFADRPELEGQNMLKMVNSEGRYIVKGMLDVIQSTKEGFYDYAWSKPLESKDTFKKIAYVKLFEPFDWMIGTGFYLDDMESKVQEKILNDEKHLLAEKQSGNYLFIGTWDGVSLTYPAKNKNMYALQDSNGKFIVQELIEKAKKGGGFVEYMMPPFKGQKSLSKMSYVESIDDWKWYVGAGIYVDDLNHELFELKMTIDEELKRTLYSILFWMLVFSVVMGGFYLIISRKIRKDFDLFITFFDSLVNKDQLIDTSKVKFKEFEELANHANVMLKAKIFSNKHLEQYKKIVSSSDDFLALIDRNYTYLAISEAYQKFFNKRKEEILGHSMPELYGAQYFVENLKHLSDRVLGGETFEHEFWALASFGKRFLHTKYFPYYENEDDPLPMAYVVSARDNTEKKANEERLLASEKELEFLAHNDALTGLPNRLLLTDRIAHAIENSKRQGGMIAVCFLDLDNFKKINDSYGHSYGDEILKQLALRLQGRIRHCDTLSRIGGDEFILLVENIKEKHEIEVIIAKIQAIFEEPFINKSQKFFLSASIGVSVYPDHGTDGETLIKNADTAMYKAKEAGKNTYTFYTLDMTIASYERIGMENALREAIKEKQFVVYYQPQIDLKTGKLIGLEALLRWNHPLEGILPPGRFIAFSEETHLIVEIGAWILKQTCIDLVSLHHERLFNGTISVNISGVQIEFSDFLSTLKETIAETKVDPSMLEIEVTESFIMHDPERWIVLLKEMQHLGMSIAIDDFGTGYSSLSYLRKLPINKLKIDMSFVKDIPKLEDACAIVNSIINLAQNMKITTLAEGIEHKDQEDYLAEHGCEQGQGYLYAKPMSLKNLKTWIQKF